MSTLLLTICSRRYKASGAVKKVICSTSSNKAYRAGDVPAVKHAVLLKSQLQARTLLAERDVMQCAYHTGATTLFEYLPAVG
jgi:hypothetical protein